MSLQIIVFNAHTASSKFVEGDRFWTWTKMQKLHTEKNVVKVWNRTRFRTLCELKMAVKTSVPSVVSLWNFARSISMHRDSFNLGGSPGDVGDVTDVGEATEDLENELWRR